MVYVVVMRKGIVSYLNNYEKIRSLEIVSTSALSSTIGL